MRTRHIQRALKNARLVYSFQGTQLSGQARCTGGFLLPGRLAVPAQQYGHAKFARQPDSLRGVHRILQRV